MAIKTTLNYSPNFNSKKRKPSQIKFIIFHYTGMKSEKEAIDFCKKNGYWTGDDCWEIRLISDDKMYKYRYKEVELLKEL